MRKPAFAYFYGLCILISFSLLTLLCGGYQISIAYCIFSFSDDVRRVSLSYMSCHMDKVVTSRSFATLPQDLMLDIIQETTSKLTIKD